MTKPGADLIAWYLNPGRLPVADRWLRKHAYTQGSLCQRFAAPVIGGCLGDPGGLQRAAAGRTPAAEETAGH